MRDYEKFKNDAKNKRAQDMKDTIVRPETQTRDVYINDHHHHDDDDNFCEATFFGFCHGEEDEAEADDDGDDEDNCEATFCGFFQ